MKRSMWYLLMLFAALILTISCGRAPSTPAVTEEPGGEAHDGEVALTFTATDAYSVGVPVRDADACADCIIAFEGDSLRLIMPGFGSSFWVKDVVSIEAK